MTEFVVRRVVIACDAVCENSGAIETAARLAARWEAALHGIFVEDPGLLQLAGLPFTRQVSLGSAGSEAFDEASVEQSFLALAERTRAALETAARQRGIPWSFSVVRDNPSAIALSDEGRDLLIVEGMTRPFGGHLRLESQWSEMPYETHQPVLLVRGGTGKGSVMALVQSGDDGARLTVAAAAKLAEGDHRRLTVLLAAPDINVAAINDWVRAVSPAVASRCRVEVISQEPEALTRALAGHDGDLLVIDADPGVNTPALLKNLVARTKADVLFVR